MSGSSLPIEDDVLRELRREGLDSCEKLSALIREALRLKSAGRLLETADRVAERGIAPLNDEEIQAEIDAVRAGQRG